MDKDLTLLTDLHAAEVSLVKAGANQKKRFPIFKEDFVMDEEILKAVLETETEGEKDLYEFLSVAKASDKGVSAARSALRILQAYKDELPKGVMAELSKIAGMSGGSPSDEEDEEDSMTNKNVKKSEEAIINKAELSDEAQLIFKAQADQIEALKKQNEEVTKALKDQKDALELKAWVEKAEKELSHYPGKSFEEMGRLLKSLNDIDEKMASDQFDTMKQASDALKESNIFKEVGRRVVGTVTKSAWEEIESLAEGIVEKSSDITFTKDKAITKVLSTDKGRVLYKKYLEQNPAQCGRLA